jgi:hypothetical protein
MSTKPARDGQNSAKPSLDRVGEGVLLLAELIPFFPKSLIAQTYVAQYIHEFVDTEEHLDWFISAAIAQFPAFEGLPALRALYNTRFAPADGIMPTVELRGYTTAELEARYQAAVLEENAQRQAMYEQQRALASAEEFAAFPLPDVKQLQ